MKYIRIADLPWNTPFPGWKGKFLSSSEMTFVYWDVPAGTILPEHSHPHEQVAHTIEGKFEITIDGVTTVLSRDRSASFRRMRSIRAGRLTDCRIMDAFCPVRETYVDFELKECAPPK